MKIAEINAVTKYPVANVGSPTPVLQPRVRHSKTSYSDQTKCSDHIIQFELESWLYTIVDLC